MSEISLDSLLPPEMAVKAEAIGLKKATMNTTNLVLLAVLAGAYIGIGAIFSTLTAAGSEALPYGVARMLIGLAFTIGLILVVVGGAELFTGNALITMAFAAKKVTLAQLLSNWAIVYFGNFIGAVLTVVIVFASGHYKFGHGAVGLTALNIANAKVNFTFVEALALGMMCNALVCMAVWLCYSARTTTDKIMAIIPPITCFVAAGFEHSVANMYFIPMGLLIKAFGSPDFFETIGKTAADFPNLTWSNFLIGNLVPVTIGNIIGGGIMVGLVYWFIYSRKTS
ncbi:MAG: formate transporter FocA [Anaerolineales bacterium]|jgi:formate transporter FocA|nr:formate transporter FocA [Anaerolineales bacterium]